MADPVAHRVLVAIQAALITASTAAGANVFLDRVDEVPQANVPAININPPDDEPNDAIERASVSFPYIHKHTFSFTIGAIGATALAARSLAAQVEACLMATRGAITIDAKPIDLANTGGPEPKDGNASVSLFHVKHQWTATFHTQAGIPDAAF